jgi:hypothetical protein
VFVEPSSLNSLPYLYVNKANTPNVPKIPKTAPYPFVKPAASPSPSSLSSPPAYRSKLEDYTVQVGHLSQKRHTPPAPNNDINRMDSSGAAEGKPTSIKVGQDEAELRQWPAGSGVPRPPGTPRPRTAEDSESEADTNTFARSEKMYRLGKIYGDSTEV